MSLELFEDSLQSPLKYPTDLDIFIDRALAAAEAIEVIDEASFSLLTNFYFDAKKWEKKIDNVRKEVNRPFQDQINANNDSSKKVIDILHQIQLIATLKTGKYVALLEEKKKEVEKEMHEIAAMIGCENIPSGMPPDKSLRGEKAVAYTKTVRDFRLIDLSKVPLKYLKINEEEVKTAIKLGIDEIAGLEIFESKITQLKVR